MTAECAPCRFEFVKKSAGHGYFRFYADGDCCLPKVALSRGDVLILKQRADGSWEDDPYVPKPEPWKDTP